METKLVLNINNFFTLGLFLFLYFNFGNQGLGHDKNLDLPANKIFGKFKTPTKEVSEPIGFYSRGCLSGAEKLDDTGEYWQVMRPARNRNWGHPETIKFTKDLSKKASEIGWKGLYIGDISGPRGGPMPYGHQSHQIGLDVDIWMYPPKSLKLTKSERDKLGFMSVRKDNLKEVNSNWTLNHAKVLEAAAKDQRVDRIFINAPAKIWMCKNISGNTEWLQKIRPLWGHHSHFHIRLKCPQGSSECLSQKPSVSQISKSYNGCDETLYWWVTKALEPPDPKKKKTPKKIKKGARDYKMEDLPKQCYKVIHLQ